MRLNIKKKAIEVIKGSLISALSIFLSFKILLSKIIVIKNIIAAKIDKIISFKNKYSNVEINRYIILNKVSTIINIDAFCLEEKHFLL